jgi:DNA invertase Pin-like site-specific DNA recombinase
MSENHSTNGSVQAIRAVAYYRMSETKQEASIPEQRTWARSACRREGVELAREFSDEGIPGDEFVIAQRKGLKDLLAYCASEHKQGRPIRAVVAWDADRFSRADSFTTAAVLDQLMTNGVSRMLTNEGWIDFEDDMQRVFFNLRQDLGKRAYSKSISMTVSRTRAERARLGLWTGGQPPFAYRVGPDGHLMFGDPEHIATVRYIFDRYLHGDIGTKLLAAELQEKGYPTRSRKNRTGWSETLVYCVLTNRHYTGDLLYNQTSAGKHHRTVAGGVVKPHRPARTAKGTKTVHNAPEVVIIAENAHPAIVSRDDFEAVQRKLAARRVRERGGRGRPAPGTYPLSGLLRCECGAPMHGLTVVKRAGAKRYRWKKYLCSRYMHSGGAFCRHNAVLESAVLEWVAAALEERFKDPAEVAELRADLLDQSRGQAKDRDQGAQRLRKRLAALGEKIERAGRNLALAKTPRDFERVSAAIAGWEAEQAALAAELEALDQAAQAAQQQEAGIDRALAAMQDLGQALREAEPGEVRDAVKDLVEKVELHFRHETTAKGRVRCICTGGEVTLAGDLGCSPVLTSATRSWS